MTSSGTAYALEKAPPSQAVSFDTAGVCAPEKAALKKAEPKMAATTTPWTAPPTGVFLGDHVAAVADVCT